MMLFGDEDSLELVEMEDLCDWLQKMNLKEFDSPATIREKCLAVITEAELDFESNELDLLVEWIAEHLDEIVHGEEETIEELIREDFATFIGHVESPSPKVFAEEQTLKRKEKALKLANLFD